MAKLHVKTEAVDTGFCFRASDTIGARWLALGPSGSGKTYAVINAIKKGWFGDFDEKHLFSPSYRQPIYKIIQWSSVKPGYDQTAFAELLYKQECREAVGIKKTMLIVVDDIITESGLRASTDTNPLATAYVRGRHLLCSVITLSQRTAGLPGALRSNASYIAFKTTNAADLAQLYGLGGVGTKGEFNTVLNSVWSTKYRPVIFRQDEGEFYAGYALKLLISLDSEAEKTAKPSSTATKSDSDSETDEKDDSQPHQAQISPKPEEKSPHTSDAAAKTADSGKTSDDHTNAPNVDETNLDDLE